jgi:hypothetical protein
MNRRTFAAAAAVAALVFSVDAAVAGSPSTQLTRIKNVGAQTVAVYAANGSPTETQVRGGAKLISPNGVAQFSIRQGAAMAFAADPATPVSMTAGKKKSVPMVAVLPFTFPRSRYVYLVAQLSGLGPSINFAAPGTTF